VLYSKPSPLQHGQGWVLSTKRQPTSRGAGDGHQPERASEGRSLHLAAAIHREQPRPRSIAAASRRLRSTPVPRSRVGLGCVLLIDGLRLTRPIAGLHPANEIARPGVWLAVGRNSRHRPFRRSGRPLRMRRRGPRWWQRKERARARQVSTLGANQTWPNWDGESITAAVLTKPSDTSNCSPPSSPPPCLRRSKRSASPRRPRR
jgi:hypothetical protein